MRADRSSFLSPFPGLHIDHHPGGDKRGQGLTCVECSIAIKRRLSGVAKRLTFKQRLAKGTADRVQPINPRTRL